MSSSTIFMLISIVVYMIGIVWIGILCSKKNKNTDDFYLGGRKLGPFVTAMSAEASDMSSWLLMGLPGVALVTGLAEPVWTAVGLAIGTYLNWLIVAKRIRVYTQICGNSSTIPAFFSNRYRDEKRILSVIAAVVIVIFFVPYTASGFSACGKLFNSLFGIDYHVAMVDQCTGYRGIYGTWRIPCGKYHGFYPEYCYDPGNFCSYVFMELRRQGALM